MMARQMTVVSTMEPVVDDEGNLLDKQGEIIDSSKKTKKDQEKALEKVYYYLLHWGLTYTILTDKGGNYPISYTVGICQKFNGGEIFLFTPDQLTIEGKEIK